MYFGGIGNDSSLGTCSLTLVQRDGGFFFFEVS